jgi:polyisoprenoid-binding protein YceI
MLTNVREDAARASRCVALVVLVIVAGCRSTTAPSPSTNASQSQSVESTATTRAGTRTLQVDPERTVVTVIVRRGGPLAKLGHDHVITSADEAGSVRIGNTPADSSFELTLPVDRLEVDLPAARAAAGLEFAAPVPDDARAGTRHNMLRAEVLDLKHFSTITLRSTAASGAWPQPIVRLAVTLKGVEREQEIPVVVERDADGLTARGQLRLNQTDFGITPFSVAGGAIRVADTLEIRFEIAAASPGAINQPRVP